VLLVFVPGWREAKTHDDVDVNVGLGRVRDACMSALDKRAAGSDGQVVRQHRALVVLFLLLACAAIDDGAAQPGDHLAHVH
jgi:hypothetical protein